MSNQTNRPRPIQMIPLRRCGSHALRLRLNFNRQFYSPYPLHIVDLMPLVERYYADLSDDNIYFQLIRDVIGLQDALMVRWGDVAFDPVDIYNAIKDQPRSVHRITWELLFQAGERHNAKVVMDKSLDNVHFADELVEMLPNIGFLNVVRDPRAQVDSMTRAIIHEFDTFLNARIWVESMDAARRLMTKYPERVLTVRFEDFLANQELVLRKICDFMGIDFMPEMLDISSSQEANKLSWLSALWESNSSAPIPANAAKFSRNLSMEEIEIIETVTKEHMEFFGYELMTQANASITKELETAALERSSLNRKKAWADLKTVAPHDYILRRYRADTIAMIEERLKNRPWIETPASA